MNTKISFLYRDASNYKVYNDVVVSGTFTVEQIGQITDSLEGGMYFIPEQIYWPVERFGSITDDDHPWCELCENDFETTAQKPTIPMTAAEVVDCFVEAKNNWDEVTYSYGVNDDRMKAAHPEVCYALSLSEKQCIIIKWGEKGYYDPGYPVGFTKEQVNDLNTRLGISENEATAMEMCSMQDLSSDEWTTRYSQILETLEHTKK